MSQLMQYMDVDEVAGDVEVVEVPGDPVAPTSPRMVELQEVLSNPYTPLKELQVAALALWHECRALLKEPAHA